ncbi:SDR family oxidoreductase [Shimia marina]|uniref:3-ketoacyl-(Acyl-carrier-protein) reductase n=1 Tax=Shimia marina TaxID=321267 RepID=A0A0P1EJK2_9RHOB|nr:SDR family oxidoreductase [Shimia marina]CUH50709.1 3-ketoacyl-(acyl-carrier-protein) reductase [Shimia marina]SFE36230.1 3alpha(or 20beta)-hydroxysteroid dehydrogenase/2-keto-3-deoxy-L-fuconate dehydrogenase [Shimia marina]
MHTPSVAEQIGTSTAPPRTDDALKCAAIGLTRSEPADYVAQDLRRIGTADEIAELARYLASDASKYTSDQPFAIDGGWTI